jgi:hypothetical protein
MSTPAPRLIVELAPHSLQFVVIAADNRVLLHRDGAADAAAVTAALTEAGLTAPPAQVVALLVPHAGFVLRANAEEATSIRTVKSLLARADAAAPGLAAPLSVVAVDAGNGQRVETVGNAPWVLAGVSAEQLDETARRLEVLGLKATDVRLALPVGVGAVVTALQDMPESTRVLLWQIGATDAQLACVSAAGCEAAATVAAGFDHIFEAVQGGLGLKFRAAASKLFFNAAYDFSDTSGAIAERLAALLRPAIAALGCKPTALHVTGLPAGQAWLAKAVASALEIEVFAPKTDAFCTQCGLKGDAPAGALGLLFQVSAGSAWRQAWLDVNAAAPAPAPVAAAPAPAPKIATAPKVAAPPAPVPTPVAAGSAAAPAPVAPKPKIVAPAPAPVAAAPVVVPAKPVITPAPVIKPEAKPAEVAPVAEVVAAPEAETAPGETAVAPVKKKSGALIGAVVAVVVLGGAGAFFATKGGDAEPAAAAAPAPSVEEIRMREMEEARMLADELKTPRSFRNERYSFEVSDRGFLRKLVGTGNKTLIDEFGWVELQGTITGTSTPFYAGTMGDTDYRSSVNKSVKDGKVVFEMKGVHPRFTIETLVTCLPDKLKIETLFKPLNMQDSRGLIAGTYMVKMTRQSLSLGQRAVIEPGKISYSTQSGPVALNFNTDVWGQAGEEGKQTFMVGSNLVFFYFAGDGAPTGTKLTAELVMP